MIAAEAAALRLSGKPLLADDELDASLGALVLHDGATTMPASPPPAPPSTPQQPARCGDYVLLPCLEGLPPRRARVEAIHTDRSLLLRDQDGTKIDYVPAKSVTLAQ